MSIKTWLMPRVMQHLLSPQRLEAKRAKFERRRAAHAAAHEVHFFHTPDDPYSVLLAGQLPQRRAVAAKTAYPNPSFWRAPPPQEYENDQLENKFTPSKKIVKK